MFKKVKAHVWEAYQPQINAHGDTSFVRVIRHGDSEAIRKQIWLLIHDDCEYHLQNDWSENLGEDEGEYRGNWGGVWGVRGTVWGRV